MLEWKIWPALDLATMTRRDFQAYIDVERALGPDPQLLQCSTELLAPLEG